MLNRDCILKILLNLDSVELKRILYIFSRHWTPEYLDYFSGVFLEQQDIPRIVLYHKPEHTRYEFFIHDFLMYKTSTLSKFCHWFHDKIKYDDYDTFFENQYLYTINEIKYISNNVYKVYVSEELYKETTNVYLLRDYMYIFNNKTGAVTL